jgi:DNA topoisomerase-3
LVINCGDAGQEGELIQRWVMNEAQYKGEVKRLWISSTEAIKEGFQNLKPSANYDNLYYAGFSRAIGDWLLVRTRLYTKHGGYKQVLSIEGCKPQHWQWSWTDSKRSRILNHSRIGNYKRCIETRFSYEEGRF